MAQCEAGWSVDHLRLRSRLLDRRAETSQMLPSAVHRLYEGCPTPTVLHRRCPVAAALPPLVRVRDCGDDDGDDGVCDERDFDDVRVLVYGDVDVQSSSIGSHLTGSARLFALLSPVLPS